MVYSHIEATVSLVEVTKVLDQDAENELLDSKNQPMNWNKE